MFILAEVSSSNFFIELLEKGGLPALALGICFTIFMFWMKSQAKRDAAREDSVAKSFIALQQEREAVRTREAEQYNELMRAYEQIVREFIALTRETSTAVATLSERVGQCPLRRGGQEIPEVGE